MLWSFISNSISSIARVSPSGISLLVYAIEVGLSRSPPKTTGPVLGTSWGTNRLGGVSGRNLVCASSVVARDVSWSFYASERSVRASVCHVRSAHLCQLTAGSVCVSVVVPVGAAAAVSLGR